jgi:hypothetical protein
LLGADNLPEKAVEAAKEGIALLPPVQPWDPIVRIRRLLEVESIGK